MNEEKGLVYCGLVAVFVVKQKIVQVVAKVGCKDKE